MNRKFPNWEALYQSEPVSKMPWFYSKLDPDIEKTLKQLKLKKGAALDLATGPGTQAIALCKKGWKVTASDISESALQKAKIRAQKLPINWIQDDILKPKLKNSFDLIIDRGCFHIFAPSKRKIYIRNITRLLNKNGVLLLKCFSHLQPGKIGPYRFKKDEIQKLFNKSLSVVSIQDSVYHGTLNPFPKALFCVIQK